jgi:hypothetical protein
VDRLLLSTVRITEPLSRWGVGRRAGSADEPARVRQVYGVYDVATSAYGNVVSFFRQVDLDDFDLLTIAVDPPGTLRRF